MTSTEMGTQMTDTDVTTGERADILQLLRTRRFFLRTTANGLTDEQAALTPTVSELCLGGLIKHVAAVETAWADFIENGPATGSVGEDDYTEHALSFRMLEGETLAVLLDRYAEVARRTDELVVSLPDLDLSHPLPEAPWNEPGARWSARQALLHIATETAQHSGHADILRETIDGAKTMG